MVFERQIEAGMKFLDQWYKGPSWVLQIDVGDLNLQSGCDCVLGQLNGDFDTMCDLMGISSGGAQELGFYLDTYRLFSDPESPFYISHEDEGDWDEDDDDEAPDPWDVLTGEWVVALKERLNSGIEL